MASSGPASVPMVPPPIGVAAGAAVPMVPASPEPKRPRQRDQAAPSAMVRDISLPQLVGEFAALHSRFARDEVFVPGVHDAVDHDAVILAQVLARLDAVEGKLTTVDVMVTQLGVDTKANDDALDAQLRTELNAMTSRLGDELRAENVKVQEAFGKLESATTAALEAARTAASTTATPPGFQPSGVTDTALA